MPAFLDRGGFEKECARGQPHGFLCDTQGTLFYDLAEILRYHRPPAFLLENVKNLERHDAGRTFTTIMHVLEGELGYSVNYRVINSSPWGAAEARAHLIIVGFREQTSFDFDELAVPADDSPTLGAILDTKVEARYTLTAHLWNYLKNYKKKHSMAGKRLRLLTVRS